MSLLDVIIKACALIGLVLVAFVIVIVVALAINAGRISRWEESTDICKMIRASHKGGSQS